MTSPPLPLVALSLVVLTPQPAQALLIQGNFEGVAHVTPAPLLTGTPLHPLSYYDGAPVSGSFEVNVPASAPYQVFSGGPGNDSYMYFFNGDAGSLSMSYTIKDARFDFVTASSPGPTSLLWLEASPDSPGFPASQRLSFVSDTSSRFYGASFSMTGPAGSLFDGKDPNTLRFDPSTPYTFGTSYFKSGLEGWFSIDLARVSLLSPVTAPVPEPATTLLLVGGGGLLAWRIRRRSLE